MRLLGPIDVVVGDTVRPVTGMRRRAVLAGLALHPGQVVSVDRLVDVVWGDRPPERAAVTLQSHVSHLRRALGDAGAVLSRAPGYLLNAPEPVTDAQVAERLVREARRTSDPADAATRLREAVALWRGQPLADLVDLPWFAGQAQRFEQLLGQARHALVEARFALGEHAELVAELQQAAEAEPLDEPTHAQLMLALYRTGRQADALAVYKRLYRQMDEQLGAAPGPALRELHTAILRQDPALRAPDAPRPSTVVAPAPAQLPAVVAGFVGRTRELDRLDELSVAGSAGVAVVSGTAGVGKTSLVVHWAHRVADRFPDGQVHVNLRGFDPADAATDPLDALRALLESFGVAAERVPGTVAAASALWRSVLAGKRVLLVLDNARDAEQVRPLLPGTPGCLAVVTSRSRLTGLVATEGAWPVPLDLLTVDEARSLLVRRLGRDRVAAEPDAVDAVIERCARLPLALAVVAARAATQPAFTLAAVAAELTGELDGLGTDDPATDVRAVFAASYRTLTDGAAELFRLLALHPGPLADVAAAASLAGRPVREVRGRLTELTRAHLMAEPVPGRFGSHDLLRAYAAELVHDDEARHTAVHRLLDHYLQTVYAVATVLSPERALTPAPDALPGVAVDPPADPDAAWAWLIAEQPALLDALRLAAAERFDLHVLRLAAAVGIFLVRQGLWQEQLDVQSLALDAARRLGDGLGQALSLRSLAATEVRLGRLDEAEARYHEILDLHERLDDPVGLGNACLGLFALAEKRADSAAALRAAERAYAEYERAGYREGQASALNAVGWAHAQLGDHRRAIELCERALAQLQDLGYRDAEAGTWDSLGQAHRHLGDRNRAIDCHRHARDIYHDLGSRFDEAEALVHLGDLHDELGEAADAAAAWRQALDIFTELDHPDAEGVRAKLAVAAPLR